MKCFILPWVCCIVGGILCSIVVVILNRAINQARRTRCALNLRDLSEAGDAYAMQRRHWLSSRGDHLWTDLSKTDPPLIAAAEILRCPVRHEDFESGQTDYRGPLEDATRLKPDAPLGADKVGNHGAEEGGNVLLKSGNILHYEKRDPLWKQCAVKLAP